MTDEKLEIAQQQYWRKTVHHMTDLSGLYVKIISTLQNIFSTTVHVTISRREVR